MSNSKASQSFEFKQFTIQQEKCKMKVGTDAVLLGAWVNCGNSNKILDIGTGTGVIAIMLAQRTTDNINIHAVEVDDLAFAQASANAEATIWKDRITIYHSSIQDFQTRVSDYDLIVCNPPFFTGGTFSSDQQRRAARHAVKLPHGDLLIAVRRLLSPEGRFAVILPFLEGMRFQELALQYNLYCAQQVEVRTLPSKPVTRVLLEFQKTEQPTVKSSHILQDQEESNQYTDAHKQLIEPFLLHL